MTLTDEDIAARVAAKTTEPAPEATYSHIRPFAQAADDLIDTVTNADGRWMFGVTDIDAKIRGVGPGELMYVTGKAHSGKTQLVLQSIANNPDAKVIVFTPDEVDVLILTKLIGITRGYNAEELEDQIKRGDDNVLRMVHRVAAEEFRNLIVVDDALSFQQMSVAMEEARHYWGGEADAVIIDFLELLPGEGDNSGVQWKSQTLKRWSKHHAVPVVCLHQASRSSGDRGKSAGMQAMKYGGETEAIFVLEVYRKQDDQSLDAHELEKHANTVSVNVVKNKRPPSRKGECDLYLHPECGQVRAMTIADWHAPNTPPKTAADVAIQREASRAVNDEH